MVEVAAVEIAAVEIAAVEAAAVEVAGVREAAAAVAERAQDTEATHLPAGDAVVQRDARVQDFGDGF